MHVDFYTIYSGEYSGKKNVLKKYVKNLKKLLTNEFMSDILLKLSAVKIKRQHNEP